MIKKLFPFLLLCSSLSGFAQQTGIGTVSPQESAALDLTAADKALLLNRVNNTAAITTPENGMVIFDKSSQCIKVYEFDKWSPCLSYPSGEITTLDCNGVPDYGSLKENQMAQNVYSVITYTGGNGSPHSGQTIASTGVTGLVATLSSGSFINGSGNLLYTITGTPTGNGTASFNVEIGGQTCTLTRTVLPEVGAVATLECGTALHTGTLTDNQPATNVSSELTYTNGDGGDYTAQSVSSTGVTGLTATLEAGSFEQGDGSLTVTITGTPDDDGIAEFALTIGGQTCTLELTVTPLAGTIASLDCAGATVNGTLTQDIDASGTTFTVSYTGGNGGSYNGQNVNSTGVSGLTAVIPDGSFADGAGDLSFAVIGTPTGGGTADFVINIGGQSCNLSIPVEAVIPIIPSGLILEQDYSKFITSIYDNDYLPYTAPAGGFNINTVAADGNTDPLVDIQGTIPTTGITVYIRGEYDLETFTNPPLPEVQAYTSPPVLVDNVLTQDGISRSLVLEWEQQTPVEGEKNGSDLPKFYIKATIKAVDGNLLVKKLDINSGLGSDYLGGLLADLVYPYNTAEATTNFSVRAVSGVPDRMFGVADNAGSTTSHEFIYSVVRGEDGSIWLKHYLGAEYTNTNSSSFDPGYDITDQEDYKAYGSLFQWGRRADGHELVNYTGPNAGTFVHNTKTIVPAPLGITPNEPNRVFFDKSSAPNEHTWYYPYDPNYNLWKPDTNNPCPEGFKVPTGTDVANSRPHTIVPEPHLYNILKQPIFHGTIVTDDYDNIKFYNYSYTFWTSDSDTSSHYSFYLKDFNGLDNYLKVSSNPVKCIKK